MTEHESESVEQLGAGLRDRFERLYTPHRMAYISGEARSDDCPFCVIPALSDAEGLVVARGETSYAVLNLFPYNSGHLMLVPYRHVSGLNPGVRNDAGFYPSAAGGVVVVAIMFPDLPNDAAGEELLARTVRRIFQAAP